MGWDNDSLIDLGFDQEDIEQASHEEMLGLWFGTIPITF
jgi:hypothetical protein